MDVRKKRVEGEKAGRIGTFQSITREDELRALAAQRCGSQGRDLPQRLGAVPLEGAAPHGRALGRPSKAPHVAHPRKLPDRARDRHLIVGRKADERDGAQVLGCRRLGRAPRGAVRRLRAADG
eukprot:9048923-Pyramimonas_sp.AAC.1